MNREKPEWVKMNLAYWAGVAGLLLCLKALGAGLLVVQAFENGDKWALLYQVCLCGLFGWASGYALRESANAMGLTRKGRRVSLHIKNREAFRRARRRLWEARVACLLFGVLALCHGAMAVAAVFEERPFAGLVGAAAAAVFYGLTVCAWRDVARAG